MWNVTDGTVVIARSDLTSALRDRFSFDPAVLVFSATEAMSALGVILKKGLRLVALDREFASAPRGSQFVSELRSIQPASHIRVLADQGSEIPVLLRRPVLTTGRATIMSASHPIASDSRRAPRFLVHDGCEAWVNGDTTALVDLSVAGAQVLSPVVLRPSQPVRIALTDDEAAIKVRAEVAWSTFERSKKTGQTHYRAGMQFTDAQQRLLEAYCTKHGIDV